MIDEKYQVDHLFLLVGTNPLPNYVAARLLIKDSQQSQIFLVFSDDTSEPRKALEEVLIEHGYKNFMDVKVDESNPINIRNQIEKYAKDLKGVVGLNYTGGTKVMAVHAYEMLHELSKPKPDGCNLKVQYSYLDARTLSLNIKEQTSYLDSVPVGETVQITIEDVLKLHGRNSKFKNDSLWPQTATILAELHADAHLHKSWQKWIGKIFFKEPEWPVEIVSEEWKPWIIDNFVHTEYKRRQWKTKTQLKETLLDFPKELVHVGETLLREIGLTNPTNLYQIMQHGSFKRSDDVGKWFEGTWLESYALLQVQHLRDKKKYSIGDIARDIQSTAGQQVQLDVTFLRGYQLFALSCTASSDKDRCKPRLLEAVVRAEQLGGAEARVGLISCYDNPNILQNEVSDLLGSKVRVFGRQHLRDLGNYLAEWIEEVSKGK
jgi:hypothetical protein